MDAAREKAWDETFLRGERTMRQLLFLWHQYIGERRLERQGLSDLFRATQQLPEYRIAEQSVKRGWGLYCLREYGLRAEDDKGLGLKFNGAILLNELRSTNSTEKKKAALRRHSITFRAAAHFGDLDFLRRAAAALSESDRKPVHDFPQILLAHWLTSFFWLMPTKSIGDYVGVIQGGRRSEHSDRYSRNTRKLISRPEWSGCFYRSESLLIDGLESSGSPTNLSAVARVLGLPGYVTTR